MRMEKKDKKLFIAIGNSQPFIYADFFWSMLALRKPIYTDISRNKHPWDFIRNNTLIQQFLNQDHDYFTRMDADQAYPEDYLEKMVPLIDEYKVIGALLFDRWRRNDFIPLNFTGFDYPRSPVCDFTGQRGIVEVPCPHTNLFFAREVLEKISPPWFDPHFSQDGLRPIKHMDVTFIEKIKEAGYKTYINLDVVVSHLSINQIDRDFYDRWDNRGYKFL